MPTPRTPNDRPLRLTEQQIEYRRHQLRLAKSNADYDFVMTYVPKNAHPPAPKANDPRVSLRRFRGQVTAWKKLFHALANRERARRGMPPHIHSRYHYPGLA